MQIRFADRVPAGDYALVLAIAGKDRSSLDRLGDDLAEVEAALGRQRFDGDAGTSAEYFQGTKGGVRRLLFVGTGTGTSPADAAEKLGGRLPRGFCCPARRTRLSISPVLVLTQMPRREWRLPQRYAAGVMTVTAPALRKSKSRPCPS